MEEYDWEAYCPSCGEDMTESEHNDYGQCVSCEDEEASQYYMQEAMEDYFRYGRPDGLYD